MIAVSEKTKKEFGISLNRILSVARTEYVKWIMNPRMVILFVTIIFIYDYIIKEQLTAADKMVTRIMIAEPFVAAANSEFIILAMPAVFLVLISDFPKTDGNTMFYIQRVGKNNWMLGQLLFAVMSAGTYLFTICLSTFLLVYHKAYISNSWSDVVTRYAQRFPKESRSKIVNLINGRLYNNIKPFHALIRTFFLQFLFLVLIAVMLFVSFAVGKRMVGMLIACSILCLGSGLCLLGSNIKWALPSAHALLWLRYDMVLKHQIVSVSSSYLYFLIMIAILMIIGFIAIKRYDFSKITDMED